MSTETIALPQPSTAQLAQHWHTAKTVVKTIVVILAVIGGAHVAEPLRGHDVPAVVQPAPPAKAGKVASGK